MTGMDDVKITATKQAYWVQVNLDDDGTPLDQHGDRMVEIAPGQWTSSTEAAILQYLEQHKPADGDHP